MYFIGLMSGTSADGVDASLLKFEHNEFSCVDNIGIDFSPELRNQILALYTSSNDEIEQLGSVASQLADVYAQACLALLTKAKLTPEQIQAIGCHGQTIRHRPDNELPFTIQIADYAKLAELTQIDVIGDFRTADIAAGGQGAPLVPAFHKSLFIDQTADLSVINIGGIANISFLPAQANRAILGFDTGPGNALMDAWISLKLGKNFDKNGQWAKQGQVIPQLLNQLLAHPYFSKAAPKSTGREIFNLDWLTPFLTNEMKAEDIQTSLAHLTCQTICQQIKKLQTSGRVLICGGGAFNLFLLELIQTELGQNFQVFSTEKLGIDPNWIESQCFAWLAYRFTQRLPGNLPSATGATKAKVLGCLYPA